MQDSQFSLGRLNLNHQKKRGPRQDRILHRRFFVHGQVTKSGPIFGHYAASLVEQNKAGYVTSGRLLYYRRQLKGQRAGICFWSLDAINEGWNFKGWGVIWSTFKITLHAG